MSKYNFSVKYEIDKTKPNTPSSIGLYPFIKNGIRIRSYNRYGIAW